MCSRQKRRREIGDEQLQISSKRSKARGSSSSCLGELGVSLVFSFYGNITASLCSLGKDPVKKGELMIQERKEMLFSVLE